jgi:hypothetical protein
MSRIMTTGGERVKRKQMLSYADVAGTFMAVSERGRRTANGLSGGRGEIRTHERLATFPVFKTGALNHSATLPSFGINHLQKSKKNE